MSKDAIAVAVRDDSLQNSPIAGADDDEATVSADANAGCYWNGQAFSDGDRICAEGTPYECHYSNWMKFPGSC